jgi:hypothetical protein
MMDRPASVGWHKRHSEPDTHLTSKRELHEARGESLDDLEEGGP